MEWQPIETAPRNERFIACEYADGTVHEMGMLWWDKMDDQLYYAPNGGLVMTWKPTHWAPLPDGPEGQP